MELKEIRNKLEQLKGQKAQIGADLLISKKLVRQNTRELKRQEEAKEIIRLVGIKTQEQLQYHISDITSLALGAVFSNPYKLEIEFIQRRNKTECDIYFTRNGNKVDPISSSGGGTIDIASFALRIASWSLQRPHSNNTIILDEPMRFVSKEYREKTSLMLKEISKKLGLQFIIVTHDPVLSAHADRVFEVGIKKGISNIKTKN